MEAVSVSQISNQIHLLAFKLGLRLSSMPDPESISAPSAGTKTQQQDSGVLGMPEIIQIYN